MIIIDSSSSIVNELVSLLHKTFSLKDLDCLNYFLTFEVHHTIDGVLFVTLARYIRDLVNKTNFLEAKSLYSYVIFS